MFDYYIWSVSLYCSVSSNGEIPENSHFWGIHNRQRFVLIPFVESFNITEVTDFPVYMLSNTIFSVCILIWDKNSTPWDEVINSLGVCITESTPRLAQLWRILAWRCLVKRLWSSVATINSSVSTLSTALLSNWWVSCKSTSAFWLRRGYWTCKGFDFQAIS